MMTNTASEVVGRPADEWPVKIVEFPSSEHDRIERSQMAALPSEETCKTGFQTAAVTLCTSTSRCTMPLTTASTEPQRRRCSAGHRKSFEVAQMRP